MKRMKIQTFSIVAGTKACNARCPFCISKMTPAEGITQKAPEICWRNFDRAVQLAKKCGVTTAMITGKGEPTLYPEQITEYVTELGPQFPIVELQTNGIAFSTDPKKYTEYLKLWYRLGLTTVSISVVHYEAERNREIYIPHKKKYIGLKPLIELLHGIGLSVRISCVLLNGYIDSEAKLETLIGICKLNEVEQLTLRPMNIASTRELQALPEEAISWMDAHRLKLDQFQAIESHLRHIGTPLMTLIHGGLVYDVRGQNVCLSNSLTIDPKTEELRQLIFFPDGHLRYDWQYEGAIIL